VPEKSPGYAHDTERSVVLVYVLLKFILYTHIPIYNHIAAKKLANSEINPTNLGTTYLNLNHDSPN